MHEDEFAVPIVKLWEHLLVPIQGELTDQQAAELSADVLDAIHQTGATSLLVDVSGVAVMDSHLCATLARLAASARLMGARSIVSGLTPEIVMTLQTMGVEMEEIQTTLSLEEALLMLGIGKLSPKDSPNETRTRPGAPGSAPLTDDTGPSGSSGFFPSPARTQGLTGPLGGPAGPARTPLGGPAAHGQRKPLIPSVPRSTITRSDS